MLRFSVFLEVELPPNEYIQAAGRDVYTSSSRKRAYVDTSDGFEAVAETTKHRVITGPLAVSCEGPSAQATVRIDEKRLCLMAGASTGGSTCQVGGTRLEAKPSIKTGVDLRPSQVEVKVLGTGISIGRSGVGVSV